LSSKRIFFFSVLALLITMHLSGLSFLYIGGSIKLAPWDILTVLIFGVWLLGLSRGRITISRNFLLSILFVFLFTVWIGVEAFRSPDPIRGFTMFLIMVRNFILFVVIGSLAGQMNTLAPLHRTLFLTSGAIAFISLFLFISSSKNFVSIVLDPLQWRPGIGYVLDQGGILRLVGFAEDPNFYSIYAVLALFLGFSLNKCRFKWLGISLIGLSLILANSRSFFLVFSFSLVTLMLFTLIKREKALWTYTRTVCISLLIVAGSGAIWSYFQGDLLEKVLRRFSIMRQSGRFDMWQSLMTDGFDDIWLGTGLRGAEVLLNGMYSHNSYLDLLVETGLVGFSLWMCFVCFITIKGAGKINKLEMIPWFHIWILLLPMMFAFSFLYNPFFWMIAAIVSSDTQGKRDVSHGFSIRIDHYSYPK
jgi:hypothetical protein